MKRNLNIFINLRGMREQVKSATSMDGTKGCYCRGCQVFTPLFFNLRGSEISAAHALEQMHFGELPVMIDTAKYILSA